MGIVMRSFVVASACALLVRVSALVPRQHDASSRPQRAGGARRRRAGRALLLSKKPVVAPVFRNDGDEWVGKRRRRMKDDIKSALDKDWGLGAFDRAPKGGDARGWLENEDGGGAGSDDASSDEADYVDEAADDDDDYEDELDAEMRASDAR